MEQNNIITYLYDKKVEDNLFTLEDVELTRLKEKVTIVDKEISNFIAKRVHPQSRKKLQRLLLLKKMNCIINLVLEMVSNLL